MSPHNHLLPELPLKFSHVSRNRCLSLLWKLIEAPAEQRETLDHDHDHDDDDAYDDDDDDDGFVRAVAVAGAVQPDLSPLC